MLTALVFLAAAAHKVRISTARTAARSHPMSRALGLGRSAPLLFAAAAPIEAAVAVGVLGTNSVALIAAVTMLFAYTAALRRLPAEEDCGCLPERISVGTSIRFAIARNVVLAAGLVATVALSDFDPWRWRQTTTGLAAGLVFVAVVLAVSQVVRLSRVPDLDGRLT
jgi:hypothetical protein